MIIDTDILIWFLRGNEKARQAVLDNSGFSISAVTYMELVQGMKNKKEFRVLKNCSGEPLITANDKHYKVVDGLDLLVFRP